MSDVEAQIRERILNDARWVDDEPYMREIFALDGVQTASAVIVEMLRSGDRTHTWRACSFTKESVIRDVEPAFTAYLPQSGIFETLRELLYSPDHHLRNNAITAIGQTGHRENVPVLIEAFPFYLERYAVELPYFMFELCWLSRRQRRRRWEYFERVIASPSYLVRWSLVGIIDQRDTGHDRRNPAARRAEQLLMRLASDEHPLVAAEAEGMLDWMRRSWEIAPDDEKAQHDHIFSRYANWPALPFEPFTWRVSQYLSGVGEKDYDLTLLDALARYLQDHPIEGPFDDAVHGRAFEAWRVHDRGTNTPG